MLYNNCSGADSSTVSLLRADQGLLVLGPSHRLTERRPTSFPQLLEQDDHLPADLRAELPLKRIWTVTMELTRLFQVVPAPVAAIDHG